MSNRVKWCNTRVVPHKVGTPSNTANRIANPKETKQVQTPRLQNRKREQLPCQKNPPVKDAATLTNKTNKTKSQCEAAAKRTQNPITILLPQLKLKKINLNLKGILN